MASACAFQLADGRVVTLTAQDVGRVIDQVYGAQTTSLTPDHFLDSLLAHDPHPIPVGGMCVHSFLVNAMRHHAARDWRPAFEDMARYLVQYVEKWGPTEIVLGTYDVGQTDNVPKRWTVEVIPVNEAQITVRVKNANNVLVRQFDGEDPACWLEATFGSYHDHHVAPIPRDMSRAPVLLSGPVEPVCFPSPQACEARRVSLAYTRGSIHAEFQRIDSLIPIPVWNCTPPAKGKKIYMHSFVPEGGASCKRVRQQ
jgi:hypothetical protein